MTRRVRGEQPLPGDTSELLQPVQVPQPGTAQWAEYLALSVLRKTDGTWYVTAVRLDPGSRRVIPDLLDSIDASGRVSMTLPEMLSYWAHELVLRDLDSRM